MRSLADDLRRAHALRRLLAAADAARSAPFIPWWTCACGATNSLLTQAARCHACGWGRKET